MGIRATGGISLTLRWQGRPPDGGAQRIPALSECRFHLGINPLFLGVTQGETWVLSPTIADSTPFGGSQTRYRIRGERGDAATNVIMPPFVAEKTGFESRGG